MSRVENGNIALDENLLEKLKIYNGDYFEQKEFRDGSILLVKIEGDKLKNLINQSADNSISMLERMKTLKPTSELYGFLNSVESTLIEFEKKSSTDELDLSYDFYSPEEKDLAILHSIYGGETTLSGIATLLDLPVSSVSEALAILHTQGFVEYNRINDGKRGRPKHIYFLTIQGEQFCLEEFS